MKRVARGDLLVEGGGDPALTYSGCEAGPCLTRLARAVARAGIRRVDGDVLALASCFGGPGLGKGWQWDDAPHAYSAPASALALDGNTAVVTVRPGTAPGQKLRVGVFPPGDGMAVTNLGATSRRGRKADLVVTRLRGRNVVQVAGTLPVGHGPVRRVVTMARQAEVFAGALEVALADAGVAVDGDAAVRYSGCALPGARLIAEAASPPLRDLVRRVNKDSDNFTAEQMLKAMGFAATGSGTAEAGARVVSGRLFDLGAPYREYHIVDGSGLSRLDLASPFAFTALLAAMRTTPRFADFVASLPIAGVDGTLEHRMRGTPAEGRVRAKTGSMTGVQALSGYVWDRAGRIYAVSILANNVAGSPHRLRRLQDRICAVIAGLD